MKAEVNSAASQPSADALREENRLLREARSLERAGNPGQALRILSELDRLFARGALLQEREVLRIQSLSATGSTSAAKTRAEQFLKRFPASPYAAHVRSILDGSSLR
jgi:outer membrane protein assembly factor BamD (BamD/ComL family)